MREEPATQWSAETPRPSWSCVNEGTEMTETEFTVGDLRRHLRGFSDDTKLMFADGLTFHRVKRRGEDLVQVELNEPESASASYSEK
jgi:hypothetical protein